MSADRLPTDRRRLRNARRQWKREIYENPTDGRHATGDVQGKCADRWATQARGLRANPYPTRVPVSSAGAHGLTREMAQVCQLLGKTIATDWCGYWVFYKHDLSKAIFSSLANTQFSRSVGTVLVRITDPWPVSARPKLRQHARVVLRRCAVSSYTKLLYRRTS